MDQTAKTRRLLTDHVRKYPELELQDLLKYLHQSALGCEHLVDSLQTAINYVTEEFSKSAQCVGELIDELDGEYSRVSLSYLNKGLSAETLGKLFFLSAKKEPYGVSYLERKLDVLLDLAKKNLLPFSFVETKNAINVWRADGYSSMHHSESFRHAYKPAYRVLSNKYLPFLPLFSRLDKMLIEEKKVILAIDGGSAAGKTTLGEMLKELYGCTVLHMDDFFLRPEQRTKARYEEIGGNVDRERFSEEVLIPLKRGEPIHYRRFDCSSMTLMPEIELSPDRLTVIEGAYSMHPDLASYYDLSVFLDISPELQKKRILKRNSPEMAERFLTEWIPLEKPYFSKMHVAERCDISILISK